MEGVTTAIVAFLFACLIFPAIVKSKPQYYAAFGAILMVILLSGMEAVVDNGAFRAFTIFLTCLLQVVAMILLILSVGGLTLGQLGSEVTEAIEVIRRGETTKEVVIPLRGDEPFLRKKADAPGATPLAADDRPEDAGSTVPIDE
jgi:hypothetical protein